MEKRQFDNLVKLVEKDIKKRAEKFYRNVSNNRLHEKKDAHYMETIGITEMYIDPVFMKVDKEKGRLIGYIEASYDMLERVAKRSHISYKKPNLEGIDEKVDNMRESAEFEMDGLINMGKVSIK